MIKDLHKVKIGPLWNEPSGATWKESIDYSGQLGDGLNLKGPLTAELSLFKLKDGVTAIVEDLNTTVELTCVKCLKSFDQAETVRSIEATFHQNPPERDFDPLENFLISRQDMSIDLSEPLRQEIILHFPLIPVCSSRCKGLCPSCGIDLNSTQKHLSKCTAESDKSSPEEQDVHKPFANLKDLFKN